MSETCNGMQFNLCNAAGKYKKVPAGEVCTIDMAKQMGIYHEKEYFKTSKDLPFTSELQTLNPQVDSSDGRRRFSMCTTSSSKDTAYPLCTLSSGVGFMRKPSSPDTCIASGCPAGFKQVAGSPNVCQKPTIKAAEDRPKFCSERWYDWIMTPNYHIGNSYRHDASSNCWEPCSQDYVPFYVVDPVDSENLDFSSVEKIDRCVPKSDYFGGKYEGTGDFCPITWIHRLGLTKDEWKEIIERKYNEMEGTPNSYMESLRSPDAVLAMSHTLYNQSQNADALEYPSYVDEKHLRACQTLHSAENLRRAYTICERVRDSPDDITEMMRSSGASEKEIEAKMKILKQSCNAVFCNSDDDAAKILGKDFICFDDVEDPDLDSIGSGEIKQTPLPDTAWGIKYLKRSVSIFILLVLGGIIVIVLYMLLSDLWKFLKPRARSLRNMFRRTATNKLVDAEEMLEEIKKRTTKGME